MRDTNKEEKIEKRSYNVTYIGWQKNKLSYKKQRNTQHFNVIIKILF